MRKVFKTLLPALMIFTVSEVFATNGLLLTSYGVRYSGMGGASLALHGSAMDLAMNPANMSRNEESAIFEAGLSYFMPTMRYEDSFISPDMESNYVNSVGNTPNKTKGFLMPHVAYTKKVNDKLAWGIAMYAAAGGGAQFDGILRKVPGSTTNPYPTIDDLMGDKIPGATMPYIGSSKLMKESTFSELQIAKITPGVSYKMGKLSLGLGLDVGVGTMEWRWTFQDPMGMMDVPGSGFSYKSDVAYALSGKVGVTYDVSDALAVSYAYQAKSRFNFNGRMSVDQGDPTKFKPGGYETSMYLDLPETHRGGLAYKIGDSMTVSFDLGYIKWSTAINTVEFKTDTPLGMSQAANLPPTDFSISGDPRGNDTNELAFNMLWEDQRVYALGFEYKPGNIAYRAGYNYGNSPIKSNGINPLFPAISEHHASVGLGISSGKLDIDFALEYAAPSKVDTGDTSNWEMFHAFSSMDPAGAKMPMFKGTVSSEIWVPQIAVKYKF